MSILVHFCEIKKPSNTSRLTACVLSHCQLLQVGIPPALGAAPNCDVADSLERLDPERTLLLYPSDDATPLEELEELEAAPDEARSLLVPDGTWAETRRLVRRYPALRALRAVRLQSRQTRYSLRRNPAAGLLCTLEAIAAALGILDGARSETLLLDAFGQWQARALEHRHGRLPSQTLPERLG